MRRRNNLRLAFTVIGLRAPLICLSVATSFLQVGSGSRLPGPLTTSIAVASGPSGNLVWSFITGLLRRLFHWWVDCGCATMSGASTGAATAGADTLRDNFIPLFDGKPTSYKEYRQRLLLYQRKMKLQKKPAEATINLLTSLTGIAWRQVEHLAETAPDAEDGFEQVLKALDQAFKYDSRVEMPRSLDKYFYGGARRPDQSLLAYCADHREALREVQKHGIKIPPEVDGYILLRRSGLTNEQKQLIQSQVGANMSASKVEEHMYFLLGQDYKNAVRQPAPAKHGWNRFSRPGSSSGAWRRSAGHAHAAEDELGDEVWDDEPNYADYAYFEDEAWEGDEPTAEEAEVEAEQALCEDEPAEEDEHLEEAYATYLDARKRLAEVKASRGYYPVVALVPGSEPSTSQLPLSSYATPKGKGKARGFKGSGAKGAKATGKGTSSTSTGPKGSTAVARAKAAQQCLRCGQHGHWASQCPLPPNASSPSPATSAKRAREGAAHVVSSTACVHVCAASPLVAGGSLPVSVPHRSCLSSVCAASPCVAGGARACSFVPFVRVCSLASCG